MHHYQYYDHQTQHSPELNIARVFRVESGTNGSLCVHKEIQNLSIEAPFDKWYKTLSLGPHQVPWDSLG